jgi:hypothetical protein
MKSNPQCWSRSANELFCLSEKSLFGHEWSLLFRLSGSGLIFEFFVDGTLIFFAYWGVV